MDDDDGQTFAAPEPVSAVPVSSRPFSDGVETARAAGFAASSWFFAADLRSSVEAWRIHAANCGGFAAGLWSRIETPVFEGAVSLT
jgi:hypothetical protein